MSESRVSRQLRAYEKYWISLKEAPINGKFARRQIHLSMPSALVKRTVKAIRKEKDKDWQFKNDNFFDPYRMHWEVRNINEKEILSPHSNIILTVSIDRKSDL